MFGSHCDASRSQDLAHRATRHFSEPHPLTSTLLTLLSCTTTYGKPVLHSGSHQATHLHSSHFSPTKHRCQCIWGFHENCKTSYQECPGLRYGVSPTVNSRTAERAIMGRHHCKSTVVPKFSRLMTRQYLISLIKHTPDMYLSELQHMLEVVRGVSVHKSTVCRSLHRAGYSLKKASISALEQNEDLRCEYLLEVGLEFSAEQLVFVDESACNRITTRRRCAWAPIGNRARRHDYFVRGKR